VKQFIKRAYTISELVKPGRVLVVYGPRRSGKTTIIKNYLDSLQEKYVLDSGDNTATQELLGSLDSQRILNRLADVIVFAIDEAQNIPNIGMALKILVDERPDMIIIATGSSSFDLANKLGEPLVGRREVITVYPFALSELAKNFQRSKVIDNVAELLVYGSYPQVYTAVTMFDKESVLKEIVDGYLLKDIFSLEKIKAPTQFLHLVRLLAQYVGQPISAAKLSGEIGLNQKTVERYLDLLEKTFIIYKVMPFSNKLSQSLKFKPKYYFYDLGIRNAILGNFLPARERNDIGQIWENFCFMERVKKNTYDRISHPRYFFYQSYKNMKEIDIIEEYNGYKAFECKWNYDKSVIALEEWDAQYPDSKIQVLSQENYWDFLVG
jgi:hypothetical protein